MKVVVEVGLASLNNPKEGDVVTGLRYFEASGRHYVAVTVEREDRRDEARGQFCDELANLICEAIQAGVTLAEVQADADATFSVQRWA